MVCFCHTPASVDKLMFEEDRLKFVQAFRNIMRIRNVLPSFVKYDVDDITLDPQRFEKFRGKLLDVNDKIKAPEAAEKVSIID
nr:hypothetical protein [uncultured Sulfitobacter sp.]